jgi:Holliday junction resolvase-like predicted endonuclease
LTEADIELSRLDRRFSLINRPLLALDDSPDPVVLVAPIIVSDATMYSLSGLMDGTLNNRYWVSDEARSYAGSRGRATGEAFEESVAEELRGRNLEALVRCKLSSVLNQKVDKRLGDIDVIAISLDRKRVWVIETKNLRLCRTEAEVASRMSEYRGQVIRDSKGNEEPDKMLRHIRRVQYIRNHRAALCHRLKLGEVPEVRGLLIVDAPQPMNFHMLEKLEDGATAILDRIGEFEF